MRIRENDSQARQRLFEGLAAELNNEFELQKKNNTKMQEQSIAHADEALKTAQDKP